MTEVGTRNLRIGPSTNPPTAKLAGPVYQTFTTIVGPQTVTIDLSTPFPVLAGSIYAFDVEIGPGGEGIRFSSSSTDDYSGGRNYSDEGGFRLPTSQDLDFGVEISPVRQVPTLSEWGLIVLGLMLITFGIVAVKERRSNITTPVG